MSLVLRPDVIKQDKPNPTQLNPDTHMRDKWAC